MWFPDHLSRGLGFLDRSGADLIWCPVLLVRKADGAEGPPDPERDILSLDGVPPEGRWRPDLFVIASSSLLRREAASRAGPWRAAKETRISPCQDWLFRAARAGLAFAFHPCPRSSASMRARGPAPTWRACRPSMNGSPPGSRTGMRPGWRRCRRQRCARRRTWHGPPAPGPWHACATPWPRGFGVHPTAIAAALRGHGRGHAIAQHRALTGEAPPLDPGHPVAAGSPDADRHFGAGWHAAEGVGRWTAAPEAELLVRAPVPGLALEVVASARKAVQDVRLTAGNTRASAELRDRAETRIAVPLPDARDWVVLLEPPTRPARATSTARRPPGALGSS